MGVIVAFDLNLFPFYRIKGQEWPQLPGLMAMLPPRRTARGREADRLVIYLTFSGNDPFSASEYNQTATRMAHQFYQTPGSVTSAIRSIAENLNQLLVDRNLRTTGKGQYILGRMILGVLRGSQFVFAQCGPTHVFHLTGKETRQIHDAQMSGRGLGIGQATSLYFSQLDLNPDDQLVLCADLPSGWEAALSVKSLVSPEALRRELLSITTEDLNAIQVQVLPGKGNLNILKSMPGHAAPEATGPKHQSTFIKQVPEPVSAPAPESVSLENHPAPVEQGIGHAGGAPGVLPTEPVPASIPPEPVASKIPTSQVESGGPASRFTGLLSGSGVDSVAGITKPQKTPLVAETPITVDRPRGKNDPVEARHRPLPVAKPAPVRPEVQARHFVSARSPGELPEIKRPSGDHKRVYRGLANIILGTRAAMRKISEGIGKFLPNLLPNSGEADSEGGGSSLAFLAIAIPVIIVTIAGLVYARYGRVTQYQDYYNMALEQAAQAHGQSNPTDVRHAWDSALYYLDQADTFQVTQELSESTPGSPGRSRQPGWDCAAELQPGHPRRVGPDIANHPHGCHKYRPVPVGFHARERDPGCPGEPGL